MKRRQPIDQETYYNGIRMVPYDLVKELAIALGLVLVLVLAASALLSSPDQTPETIQSWSQNDPVDFVTTATGELAGTTITAQYGAPYNSGTASVQGFGFFSPQSWAGVREPVDAAQDFVLKPLSAAAGADPNLKTALSDYTSADPNQQKAWLEAFTKALKDAKVASDGTLTMASGEFGPLPQMMASLLVLGRAGGLDGYLVSNGHFYQTDYTLPLLFMGDGGYLPGLGENQHLLGSQWGMMNETGSYPGQTWLWLYTFWYQIPPFTGNANADLMVVITMTVLSLALLLVPFIPGLRDIPRWIPVYRLIWRSHYAGETPQPTAADGPSEGRPGGP